MAISVERNMSEGVPSLAMKTAPQKCLRDANRLELRTAPTAAVNYRLKPPFENNRNRDETHFTIPTFG